MVARKSSRFGDIVWVNFNPTQGHEQRGKRPAVIVSRDLYNRKTTLRLVCPITKQEKGYPFEVPVSTKKVSGCILADQVRSLDLSARNAEIAGKASAEVMEDVVEKLLSLIEG